MKSVKARNTGQLQNVVIGVVVNWLGQILNFISGSTEIQLDVVTQPVLGDRNFLDGHSMLYAGHIKVNLTPDRERGVKCVVVEWKHSRIGSDHDISVQEYEPVQERAAFQRTQTILLHTGIIRNLLIQQIIFFYAILLLVTVAIKIFCRISALINFVKKQPDPLTGKIGAQKKIQNFQRKLRAVSAVFF